MHKGLYIQESAVAEEFDMPEPTKVMVAGDWHCNHRWSIQALKTARLAGCDAIIHLGDFGYWPRDPYGPGYYKNIVRYLRDVCEGRIILYWIDGNHEDHMVLNGNPTIGNEVIRHLPRGHRWRWWDKTWMAVGGGVSVNKQWLKEGVDWFSEEQLTMAQFEHCLRPGDVDVVVAHDTPSEVAIPGIHAQSKLGELTVTEWPRERIDASWEHRAIMSEIAKDKRPGFWFHGHYHVRYNGEWIHPEVPSSTTRIIGMDCDGSEMDLNTLTITREDLA